jgi:phosphatidylglycerophosphatase A
MARILDIIKPPPARQSQNLHGGLGIVMDDLISTLYALAANHAIWFLYLHFTRKA